ncbi:MAG: multidrug effflux MFS transporter [Legionellaceae bacterium]|nr:multidrug effflux MFS transporter [Legionellaceae bacterium]
MKNKLSEKILNFFPIALVIYEISNYLANDAYLPAMPGIAEQLQTTNHLVQLTLTSFFLGNATMQLILGPISDRYGRRVLLLGGGIIFIITTLICALSHNIYTLLIIRFFQGAAVTSMIIAGYATVHAMYDQVRAIKTLAWMNGITVLAPALGPLFGGMILVVASWRWIFIILAIWAFFAWIALFKFMPETCETPIPIKPKKLMKQYGLVLFNKRFISPMLTLSILYAVMISWIAAGPFLVMDTFHYSAVNFGLIQGLVFGAFIIGTHLVTHLIEKIPLGRITKISILLAMLGAGFGFIGSLVITKNLLTIVIPMMVFALGAGIGFPVLNRLSIEGSDEPMGIKMALFATFLGMSAFLGSIIISSFYTGTVLGFASIILGFSVFLIPLYFIQQGGKNVLLSK